MNHLPKRVLPILICLGLWAGAYKPVSGQSGAYDPARLYSEAELHADLDHYRQLLLEKHPGLYTYSSIPGIDFFFDSLAAGIDRPMTEREFFNLLSTASSRIRDGHTHIFPSDAAMAFQEENGRFLPLKIVEYEGKLYTTGCWCSNDAVPPGAEILGIGDRDAADIWHFMMERQIRDGYNTSYPEWILNRWFRNYYAFHYGWSDYYDIRYQAQGQPARTVRLAAMSNEEIAKCRPPAPGRGQGIALRTDTLAKTAVLTIRDFHGEVLRSVYGQRFKPVISRHFESINRLGIQDLVIDLRDNQGGDIGYGAFLLAYLIDRPFKTVEGGYGKVRRNGTAGTERLRNTRGPSRGWHQPRRHTYKGRLYMLINGGSFSNSAIVCSALRRYTRCTVVGEESGGNPALINGSGNYSALPNTRIKVLVPDLQFRIQEPASNNGRGIMPDYTVRPGLADQINNQDLVLAFTLNLIHTKRSEK